MNGAEDKREKANVLGTHANGKSYLPRFALDAIAEANNKTNSAHDDFKENAPTTMANNAHSRKVSSGSLSSLSPDASRIPLPTSRASPRQRQPLTIAEAFKLAEDDQRAAARGSPSPAPRATRQVPVNPNYKPLAKMFPQRPIEIGRLGKRPADSIRRDGTYSSKDSFGSSSHKGEESDSDIDHKLKQFEEDEKIVKSMKEDKKGLFTKLKPGVNGARPRPTSARRTSNSSFGNGNLGNGSFGNTNAGTEGPRGTWGNMADPDPNWLRRFAEGPKGEAAQLKGESVANTKRNPSDQGEINPYCIEAPLVVPRPVAAAPSRSPGRSFAWQADEDFTAGDLEVSNSPPVSFGRTNTKLDELRKLEMDAERRYPVQNRRFTPQRTNTKLDEIMKLEKESLLKFPVPSIEEPSVEPVGQLPSAEEQRQSPSSPQPANTNGDASRAKEIEDPMKKALTKTRLDEIRERQSPSRSPSPEPRQAFIAEVMQQSSPPVSRGSKTQSQTKTVHSELEGEKVPDTPVIIYKNGSRESSGTKERESRATNGVAAAGLFKGPFPAKEDSQDLLRRLARASSKSPSPSPAQENFASKAEAIEKMNAGSPPDEKVEKVASDDKNIKVNGGLLAPLSRENKEPSPSKPTVGFADIPRSTSADSASSKKSRPSSMVSDNDPTDRIEAEMKLFAPLDNMSERGSTRAPSPGSESDESEAEDEDVEETPKPSKFDTLSLPTPRVSGAYVETPATVKTEQAGVKVDDDAASESAFLPPRKQPILQVRDQSASPRASKSDGQREHWRSSSISKLKRSKSVPRTRSPLKNSIKPPTVKEDLQQILKVNNIEDSTVDDFTDLIMSAPNAEELQEFFKNEVPGPEGALADMSLLEQLQKLDGMSRSLKNGLAGIRTAKKGIERLEDRVSNSEKHAESTMETYTNQAVHADHASVCPYCLGKQPSNTVAYVHVPVPRLWHAKPKFKLTLLGWIAFLFLFIPFILNLYAVVEDEFWVRWGKPDVCYRGSPCNTDPDLPAYGHVIPVKLDEWLTGGILRPYAAQWEEDVSDGWEDFKDWFTGTDIRNVDFRAIRDSDKREQYWRRIEKKGLFPEWNPDPRLTPMFEAWERESLEEEAAEARGETEYEQRENPADESMAKDQPVFGDSTDQPPRIWW